MRKLIVSIVSVAVVLCGAVASSEAALDWTWEFTNNFGTYGPTDVVVAQGRIYNNSTAGETIGGLYGSDSLYYVGSAWSNFVAGYDFAYGYYDEQVGQILFFEQFNNVTIQPQSFFDFKFASFYPQGTVSPGDYVDTNTGLELYLRDAVGAAGSSSLGGYEFHWAVGECPEVVPEPASMLLCGIGLAGAAFFRRKRT